MDIIENATGAAMFYDRIAKTYGLTFRFNRYNHSLEQYLSEHLPSLAPETRILDAGCGTGLLTKALLSVIDRPVSITGLDLSAASISLARQAVSKYAGRLKTVSLMQGNILSLPFADNSFELVVTCGALEYVPPA